MEFMSKFLLKFLWWCISHELMIRNHSYFNHRTYRVCFVSVSLDPGSMPGGEARGQNLGHLYFGSKFWFKFHWWCIFHEPMIRNHSYFNHRYPIGFALFLSVRTMGPCPGVGLEVKI